MLLKQSKSLEEAEAELRRQLTSETSHHIVQVRKPAQAPRYMQKPCCMHDAFCMFTYHGNSGTQSTACHVPKGICTHGGWIACPCNRIQLLPCPCTSR